MQASHRHSRHPALGTSPVPLYLQLADIFRQRIARGTWPRGEQMPTIAELQAEFGVSRVTVRQAIHLLSAEGLVSAHRGRGTLINDVPAAQKQLRVDTTLADLVAMYRFDKPVLTNIAESNASPDLREADGRAAPSYFHMRRVHARDGVRYCANSLYIDERIFRLAPDAFRSQVVIPLIVSLPGVKIGRARQTMHIGKADVDVAQLLGIPAGEPVAEVRRIFWAPDGTVIYLADVTYRGDYVHLEMDLRP